MRRPGDTTRTLHRLPVDRDRIWQSMRMLRAFSQPDLVATADAGIDNVRRYVRGLLHAGLIMVTIDKLSGVKGGHTQYRLLRDVGPHAPRLRTDGTTYDPNKRRVYAGGIRQQRGLKT